MISERKTNNKIVKITSLALKMQKIMFQNKIIILENFCKKSCLILMQHKSKLQKVNKIKANFLLQNVNNDANFIFYY